MVGARMSRKARRHFKKIQRADSKYGLQEIASAIQTALQPLGVAILVDAKHQCMTTRGVKKPDVSMVTTRFTGVFKDQADLRERFYQQINLR